MSDQSAASFESQAVDQVRDVGAATIQTVRRRFARTVASLIRSDTEAADVALELGIVDRRWLEDPDSSPITTSAPSEVMERFWERAVEKRPSRIAQLGLGAAQLIASRLASSPSGRPEPMAVLFTDLEGFTAYTDEFGDSAALELLAEHHRLAGPVVRREGGRIVKYLGDGMLCTFGNPQGGLRAAVGLLASAPDPLRLRAGVHYGEVITTAEDVLGHAVNVAARVAETARGGQAVASSDALDAAGDTPGVGVGKPRNRRLKGISDRVAIAVVKPAPAMVEAARGGAGGVSAS